MSDNKHGKSGQYVYSMNHVSKVVPPKREILKDISLSFFPGAKIGVLGLNGSGKSTLLKIMAGIDTDIQGEARPQSGIKIGYLAQEPQLNPEKNVRGNVEEGLAEAIDALAGLDKIYAAYAEPDADFDALAKEQARLEDTIQATDAHNIETRLNVAADALRLPDWEADITTLSGGEQRRVALARLLLSEPDMLLLDEPTNHLDIESREALVEALTSYSGAVILVSHDMHLLSLVADRLWLIKDGAVIPYEEDLEAYRKMLLSSNKPEAKSKASAKKDKPRPSRDQILGLRGEVRTCEARVTKLNEMRDKLAKKLGDPAMYQPEKIVESEVWQKKYSEVMTALERAETLWMTALEKLDKAENQA